MFWKGKARAARTKRFLVVFVAVWCLVGAWGVYVNATTGILHVAPSARVPFSLAIDQGSGPRSTSSEDGSVVVVRLHPGPLDYLVSADGYVDRCGTVDLKARKRNNIDYQLTKQPVPREISGPVDARFPLVLSDGTAICFSRDQLVRVNLSNGSPSPTTICVPFLEQCWWAGSGSRAVVRVTNDARMAAATPGSLFDPAAGPRSNWLLDTAAGVLGELPPGLNQASFSVDGSVLAYALQDGEAATLCVYRAGQTTLLSLPAACPYADVSLSPTGDSAAVFTREGDDISRTDLYVVDTASGKATRLTDTGYVTAAVFAPDGKSIVFQRGDKEKNSYSLYSVPATGGTEQPAGVYSDLKTFSFAGAGVLLSPSKNPNADQEALAYRAPGSRVAGNLLSTLPGSCIFVGSSGNQVVYLEGKPQCAWYTFTFDFAALQQTKGGKQ